MVKRAGSSFKLNDKSYHGKDKLLEFLTTDTAAFKALEDEIRGRLQILPTEASPDEAVESDDVNEAINLEE
jgi:hypothetical protein